MANCLRTPNEWLGWKRRRVLEAVALAADEDAAAYAAAAFCEGRRFPAGKEPSEAASARRSGVLVSVSSTLQFQLARAAFPQPQLVFLLSCGRSADPRAREKRKGKTAVSPSNQRRKGWVGLGWAVHYTTAKHHTHSRVRSGTTMGGRERKRQAR